MTTAKERKYADQRTAADTLRGWLKPGSRVWVGVQSVSRSGMSRTMKAYAVVDDEIRDITWHVAKVFGYKLRDDGSVSMSGCGMGYDPQAGLPAGPVPVAERL